MSLLDLKAEMVRHRIRQRQVAALLGLSEGRLSDILLGVKPVDSDMVRRIREAIETLKSQHDSR